MKNWLKKWLGIIQLGKETKDLQEQIRKQNKRIGRLGKVDGKSMRYDEIERARSRRRKSKTTGSAS